MSCLDKDMIMERIGLPMLWKKLPVTIWKPMSGNTKKTILIPFLAISVSAGSDVNILMHIPGKNSPIIKPSVVVSVANRMVSFRTLITLLYWPAP